jgi:BMFP domain-containing protein YqiC
MTVRLAPVAPINDPTTPWRPNAKVIHRAHPQVVVRKGNHNVDGVPLQPLRGWSPVEVLHFPWRSGRHAARKATHHSQAAMHHSHGLVYAAARAGELTERYEAFVLDDAAVERGLADGALVEDTRLRDLLRELAGAREVPAESGERRFGVFPKTSRPAFPRPDVVEDVSFAVETSVYAEAELVRAQRQLDDLEQRVGALERRPWHRAVRAARRVAHRGT